MEKFIKKLLFASVIIVLTFYACNPDEEEPFVDPRDNYVGSWLAEETSTLYPNPITFTVNITLNPSNSTEVLISNFYHLGNADEDKVSAKATKSSLTIQSQSVCNLTIYGSGSLSGNTINLTYYVNDGADIDEVAAVYTKQ